MIFKNILVFSLVTLFLCSCGSDYPQDFEFDGFVGEEKITFEAEQGFGDIIHCELVVNKKDGRVIKYFDTFCTQKLDSVFVKTTDYLAYYSGLGGNFEKMVVIKAQKQFDDYLVKIKKAKMERASKLLDITFRTMPNLPTEP
ncbi:MAG: hypothetical protein Q8O83_03000 [bacterium]|nr:hypothetical protein [bacterium]